MRYYATRKIGSVQEPKVRRVKLSLHPWLLSYVGPETYVVMVHIPLSLYLMHFEMPDQYVMYLILVSTMHNVGLGDASNDVVSSFITVATPVNWEQKSTKCGKEALRISPNCSIVWIEIGIV